MDFFLYENLTFRTNLNTTEVKLELLRLVEAPWKLKNFWLNKNSKPFIGKLHDNSFEIKLANRGMRNSSIKILGEIIPQNDTAIIKIKFKVSAYRRIFMSFWLGVVSLFILGMAHHCINAHKLEPTISVPILMLIGGYGITYIGFKMESQNAQDILEKSLNLKSIDIFNQ
jgi:hypothetical protein